MNLETLIYQWLARDRSSLIPLLDIQKTQLEQQPYHLICTADVHQFMVEFFAAVSLGIPVFLTDPRWGKEEQQQLQNLIEQGTPIPGQIMIPTGGTSGQLKFSIHTLPTLSAAVQGFQEFYGFEQINSHCLLPLHHVSGLMQLWRSLLTNGHFTTKDSDICPPLSTWERVGVRVSPAPVISLVPTQLQRWLTDRSDWLRSFQAVLIGGAPTSIELLEQARLAQIPLSPSYGMTETAAMISALTPPEFLAGMTGCGQVLPHAQIQIQTAGQIAIKSASLMLGYYASALLSATDHWLTEDIGEFDDAGSLQILGRASSKIISGGEKIFPAQVEAVIMSTGFVSDVCVFGVPDLEWGERVVACYVGDVNLDVLKRLVADRLSFFKQPKDWYCVFNIPRNSQEKVNIFELKRAISNG
jgi:o-succinylbenzoate---CoA ligase